jgi:uncharacterized membrane protein YeaQ/YmgE (transglycosylase-associated protein family)
VGAWTTIAAGIVVGLLYKRFAAAHPFGAVADMLLGITGAFAARWFMDVLRVGMNAESYSWIFVLAGAALPPWSFHGFRRRHNRIQQLQRLSVSRQDSQVSQPIADPQADSRPVHLQLSEPASIFPVTHGRLYLKGDI